MDRHEQHHQRHEKERAANKEHEKESERREEKNPRQIHPAWFVGVGVVLIVLIVLAWILVVA